MKTRSMILALAFVAALALSVFAVAVADDSDATAELKGQGNSADLLTYYYEDGTLYTLKISVNKAIAMNSMVYIKVIDNNSEKASIGPLSASNDGTYILESKLDTGSYTVKIVAATNSATVIAEGQLVVGTLVTLAPAVGLDDSSVLKNSDFTLANLVKVTTSGSDVTIQGEVIRVDDNVVSINGNTYTPEIIPGDNNINLLKYDIEFVKWQYNGSDITSGTTPLTDATALTALFKIDYNYFTATAAKVDDNQTGFEKITDADGSYSSAFTVDVSNKLTYDAAMAWSDNKLTVTNGTIAGVENKAVFTAVPYSTTSKVTTTVSALVINGTTYSANSGAIDLASVKVTGDLVVQAVFKVVPSTFDITLAISTESVAAAKKSLSIGSTDVTTSGGTISKVPYGSLIYITADGFEIYGPDKKSIADDKVTAAVNTAPANHIYAWEWTGLTDHQMVAAAATITIKFTDTVITDYRIVGYHAVKSDAGTQDVAINDETGAIVTLSSNSMVATGGTAILTVTNKAPEMTTYSYSVKVIKSSDYTSGITDWTSVSSTSGIIVTQEASGVFAITGIAYDSVIGVVITDISTPADNIKELAVTAFDDNNKDKVTVHLESVDSMFTGGSVLFTYSYSITIGSDVLYGSLTDKAATVTAVDGTAATSVDLAKYKDVSVTYEMAQVQNTDVSIYGVQAIYSVDNSAETYKSLWAFNI